ncbi:MAG: hypothetical protein KDD61_08480 [Bdellovibrionales bacterium]|nr:hypothetical protein [Bdellovibrionales bacterium]
MPIPTATVKTEQNLFRKFLIGALSVILTGPLSVSAADPTAPAKCIRGVAQSTVSIDRRIHKLIHAENGIVYHRQCFATCYFESAMSSIEVEVRKLKEDHHLHLLRIPAMLAILESKNQSSLRNPFSMPDAPKGTFRFLVEDGSLNLFHRLKPNWLHFIQSASVDIIALRNYENEILQRLESEINQATSQVTASNKAYEAIRVIVAQYWDQFLNGHLYPKNTPPIQSHSIKLKWIAGQNHPKPTSMQMTRSLEQELEKGNAPVLHHAVRKIDFKAPLEALSQMSEQRFFTTDRQTIFIVAFHGVTLVGTQKDHQGNTIGFLAKDSSRSLVEKEKVGDLRIIPLKELFTLYDNHYIPMIDFVSE